jgi:regulator of protease activity HflC (stomatin/prohibitin superfamily)
MPLIIDVAMITIGAEMLLNFVLNLYRPRRPGEYLRPGFDSRVLAFVAAPDRLAESISDAINYQFGFNVSSTWFYRLLSRSIGGLLLLGLLIIWGMSVVAVVKPDEKGLKLANGRLAAEVSPGLVWKLPWPFGKVETFPASAVNEINIGAGKPKPNEPILWTNAHATEENYFLVQPGREATGTEAASGMALLAAEVPVHYNVSDLRLYTDLAQDGPSSDRQRYRQSLLRAVASSAIIERMANYSVEQVLGAERGGISHALAADIQKAFDTLNDGRGAGVRVMFVGLNGVHPERETAAPAFEKVVQADQARQGKIEAARGQAIKALATVAGDVERARLIVAELDTLEQMRNRKADAEGVTLQEQKVMDLIIGAGGEAATIISNANARRWARHMGERARAVRSEGQLAAYRAAPRAYKMSVYLDALHDAMRDVRVWVTPFDNLRIRTDFTEVQPDISAFEADLEKNQGN